MTDSWPDRGKAESGCGSTGTCIWSLYRLWNQCVLVPFFGLIVVDSDEFIVMGFDTVTNVLTVASVYGYMKKPMKSL